MYNVTCTTQPVYNISLLHFFTTQPAYNISRLHYLQRHLLNTTCLQHIPLAHVQHHLYNTICLQYTTLAQCTTSPVYHNLSTTYHSCIIYNITCITQSVYNISLFHYVQYHLYNTICLQYITLSLCTISPV